MLYDNCNGRKLSRLTETQSVNCLGVVVVLIGASAINNYFISRFCYWRFVEAGLPRLDPETKIFVEPARIRRMQIKCDRCLYICLQEKQNTWRCLDKDCERTVHFRTRSIWTSPLGLVATWRSCLVG